MANAPISSLRAGELGVARPEWGTKRICQNCGSKFYDLQRQPITCPSCGAEFDPEALLRSRRSRPVSTREGKVDEAAQRSARGSSADEAVEGSEEAEAAHGKTEEIADQEDEEGVIEDPSELGEDRDDVAEVLIE